MNQDKIKKYDDYFSWQNKSRQSADGQLKFSKKILEPIRYYLYSLITLFIARKPLKHYSCDILFLHASEKSKALHLRDPLILELNKKGLIVLETAQQRPTTILKKRLLNKYQYPIPFKYLFIASYVQFIVERYQPKIIITDRNGSIYSSFLKEAVQPYGKLVHIAHCVATDNFARFSLIDYDYYFLYGTSSLDKIMQRSVRFGSTKAVLTGSYFAHKDFNLSASRANKNILLFGMYPDLEKKPTYYAIYNTVKQWAKNNSDMTLYFKPHPRSHNDYWQLASHTMDNIIVLEATEKLPQALENIAITLSVYTNAVIDAALLKRPSLLLASEEMGSINDELDLEQFYLPKATNPKQLQENINTLLNDYPHYIKQAQAFAQYHLEYQQDSIEYISHCLLSIAHGEEDFPWVSISEKMPD